jgi:hypothetical protein
VGGCSAAVVVVVDGDVLEVLDGVAGGVTVTVVVSGVVGWFPAPQALAAKAARPIVKAAAAARRERLRVVRWGITGDKGATTALSRRRAATAHTPSSLNLERC